MSYYKWSFSCFNSVETSFTITNIVLLLATEKKKLRTAAISAQSDCISYRNRKASSFTGSASRDGNFLDGKART